MSINKLSYELFKSLENFYYNPQFSILSEFYQGETRVLILLARCKENGENFLLPSDIVKRVNMTSPRVSSILNSLEKKEFIHRDFSTKDRRKVYVTITQNGIDRVLDIINQTYDIFTPIIQNLGEVDTIQFIDLLNRINKISNSNGKIS